MKHARSLALISATVLFFACSPNSSTPPQTAVLSAPLAGAPATTFSGKRGEYLMIQTAKGYTVKEIVSGVEVAVSGVSSITFADYIVNLSVGTKSKTIASSDLQSLIELYIAFFNRLPDADGLAYWIDQRKAGVSLDQIADHFYNAAILYSDLTGYTQSMSDADFVRVIYKNVLGRFDATAPPDADVNYWSNSLSSGQSSRGNLVRTMLFSAHTFADDATWGWVPQLLDNKLAVGNYFALQHGLNFKTPEESISKTMAIAQKVTSNNFTEAMSLIDVGDKSFNLSIATTIAPSGQGAPCPADINTPLFDTSPIAIEDFIAFRPLGFMSAPIHMFPAKHSAFSMTPIGQTPVPKPVRAPGNVVVTEMYEAAFSTGARNYQVFMRPCGDVRAYFGHLVTISDKLLAEFNKEAPKCNSFYEGNVTMTTCRRENLSIALTSGEQFGTGPDTAGVDFGVLDFRRAPARFINLEHYDTYYPFYTSPLDYYTVDVRAAIENKTGNVFGTKMRTVQPIGGTYMQDIAGTAQGNWFLPGKNHKNSTDMSIFVGLAHDYVNPDEPVMSLGSSVKGAKQGLYSYVPSTQGVVNRDFKEIQADGKVYCIENFKGGQTTGGLPLSNPASILLLWMPDYSSLKLELVNVSSCAASNLKLSSNATLFVR